MDDFRIPANSGNDGDKALTENKAGMRDVLVIALVFGALMYVLSTVKKLERTIEELEQKIEHQQRIQLPMDESAGQARRVRRKIRLPSREELDATPSDELVQKWGRKVAEVALSIRAENNFESNLPD